MECFDQEFPECAGDEALDQSYERGFKAGLSDADFNVHECLHAVRGDLESAGLSDVALTGAKLAVEMVARLIHERWPREG